MDPLLLHSRKFRNSHSFWEYLSCVSTTVLFSACQKSEGCNTYFSRPFVSSRNSSTQAFRRFRILRSLWLYELIPRGFIFLPPQDVPQITAILRAGRRDFPCLSNSVEASGRDRLAVVFLPHDINHIFFGVQFFGVFPKPEFIFDFVLPL